MLAIRLAYGATVPIVSKGICRPTLKATRWTIYSRWSDTLWLRRLSLSRKQVVTDVRPVPQKANVSGSVLGYIRVSETDSVKVINLTVIHVRELIHTSHTKTNKCTSIKIIFFATSCHNSDMFRFILIIFGEVFNTNKANTKYGSIIKHIDN